MDFSVGVLLVLVAGIVVSTAVTSAGGGRNARTMKICVDDTTGAMRVKGGSPCGAGETKKLIPKGKRINADTVDKMHAVEFLDKATYDVDGDGVADGGLDGFHCWDLNMNNVADPEEDVNGDQVVDVHDCQGPPGADGPVGPQGPQGPKGNKGNKEDKG